MLVRGLFSGRARKICAITPISGLFFSTHLKFPRKLGQAAIDFPLPPRRTFQEENKPC
jgi:hypothetical protein